MISFETRYLNEIFKNGYNAGIEAPNPSLHSSRAWEAFELGRWMHQTGRPISPVHPSRGHTWRTDTGMIAAFTYLKDGKFKLERTQ